MFTESHDPGSLPSYLQPQAGEAEEGDWAIFGNFLASTRINVNVRQNEIPTSLIHNDQNMINIPTPTDHFPSEEYFKGIVDLSGKPLPIPKIYNPSQHRLKNHTQIQGIENIDEDDDNDEETADVQQDYEDSDSVFDEDEEEICTRMNISLNKIMNFTG